MHGDLIVISVLTSASARYASLIRVLLSTTDMREVNELNDVGCGITIPMMLM